MDYRKTATLHVYRVEGACLAGENVPDGAGIVIDHKIPPEPGDITTCYINGVFSIKKYLYHSAESYVVATNYDNGQENQCFCVPSIEGVAVACIAGGRILWTKNIDLSARKRREERRKSLPPSNIGAPIRFRIEPLIAEGGSEIERLQDCC